MQRITKPRFDFISTLPEFYAIKVPKKTFQRFVLKTDTHLRVWAHVTFSQVFQLQYLEML